MRAAGVVPGVASHFLTQCVFCFFAEDTGLLPGRLFERLVAVQTPPEKLRVQLQHLFETFPFPAGLAPANTAHQKTESVAGPEPAPQPSPASGRGRKRKGAQGRDQRKEEGGNPCPVISLRSQTVTDSAGR